jgi:hypothetical protein
MCDSLFRNYDGPCWTDAVDYLNGSTNSKVNEEILTSPDDDPTQDDTARVTVGSKIISQIQKFMADADPVRECVPCTIRFNPLATSFIGLSDESGIAGANFNSKNRRNRKAGHRNDGRIQGNKLILGSSEDIARLTMNTIWFSPNSARAVWRFTQRRTDTFLRISARETLQVQ